MRVALAVVAAVLGASAAWVVRGQPSEAAAYAAPRLADGRPDLNGIWQAVNTANWNIQDRAASAASGLGRGEAQRERRAVAHP